MLTCRQVEKLIDQYDIPAEGSSPIKFDGQYATSTMFQIQVILWKCNLTYWRYVPPALVSMKGHGPFAA